MVMADIDMQQVRVSLPEHVAVRTVLVDGANKGHRLPTARALVSNFQCHATGIRRLSSSCGCYLIPHLSLLPSNMTEVPPAIAALSPRLSATAPPKSQAVL